MNANVTLNQIIWEEVRKYRLEQRAKQLQEIVITPTTKSTSSTTTASTTAKGSNTTAKTSATKTTTATAKPTASTSPFKNQDEASLFHKYAEGELQGGKAAKPDMNDPKLIDLYYKYKDQYKKYTKLNSTFKKNQEIDPKTGKPTGGVKAGGDFFMGWTLEEWIYAIAKFLLGTAAIAWIWRLISKGRASKSIGNLTRHELQDMISKSVNQATPEQLSAMAKDRNWFMTRLTNFFRKNRAEVNKAFKDMDQSARDVSDTEIIEIGEAVGKSFANKQVFIAAQRKLLSDTVKTLNAGKIPRGMTLSQFLDHLSPAQRAKHGAKIKQRWEHIARQRTRKATGKKLYNKGKKKVQQWRQKD